MRFPLFLALTCCLSAFGQQPTTDAAPAKPAPVISPTARLQNAKTIFLKQIAGNDLAFEVVNNAMTGWPRYIVVDSLEKADLLMEISAPAAEKKDDSSKTSVQGNSGSGRDPRAMTMPPPTYSDTDVKLTVRDPHTKAVLWSGREPAKEAFRQAKTDENLMEAAQKLVRKFQDRVEPAPTTPQQ